MIATCVRHSAELCDVRDTMLPSTGDSSAEGGWGMMAQLTPSPSNRIPKMVAVSVLLESFRLRTKTCHAEHTGNQCPRTRVPTRMGCMQRAHSRGEMNKYDSCNVFYLVSGITERNRYYNYMARFTIKSSTITLSLSSASWLLKCPYH